MNLKARREEMCADFEDKGEAAVQDALLHGDMSGTKVHLAKVWLEEQKEARRRAEALEVEEKQEREARESERRAQDGAEKSGTGRMDEVVIGQQQFWRAGRCSSGECHLFCVSDRLIKEAPSRPEFTSSASRSQATPLRGRKTA